MLHSYYYSTLWYGWGHLKYRIHLHHLVILPASPQLADRCLLHLLSIIIMYLQASEPLVH